MLVAVLSLPPGPREWMDRESNLSSRLLSLDAGAVSIFPPQNK